MNEKIDAAVKIDNVSVCYRLYNSSRDRLKEALHPRRKKYHKNFYALKNVNLEIRKGEIVGLVGKNGSGKSTLLKIISGVLKPSEGKTQARGRISAILELGGAFHPNYTGRENIYFYGAMMGFTQTEMKEKINDIITFADIGEYIEQPVKLYSSGMTSRLAFAINTAIEPEILILDEVLSVGDEYFKRKCYAKMEEFFKAEKTIIYVSHNVQSVNELCNRALLIDKGQIILDGPTKMVTMYYQNLLFAKGNVADKVKKEIDQLNKDLELKKKYDARDEAKANFNKIKNKDKIKNKQIETGENGYLIPDFVSKSINVQKFYDVEIFDAKLETDERQQVNVLKTGLSYYLTFKVKIKENINSIQGVMTIKTAKGVNLSSHTSPGLEESYSQVNKGEVIEFRWKFRCVLLQGGNYYINLSVIKNDRGEKEYLCRISDAIIFKVENEKITSRKGMIDFEQESVVRAVEKE